MTILSLLFYALPAATLSLPAWSSVKNPWGSDKADSLKYSLFSASGPVSPQILKVLQEPNEINYARNSYIERDESVLKLNGIHWTSSGANVYWLGLDENVIPPAGEPFYAPLNASYPTKGRITEAMNILVTLGAKAIRSQTLGVSTGNPLSIEPTLGVFNEKAFDTIDWSIYQARQHGLRILIPLTDAYDYYHGGRYSFLRWRGINITQQDASPRVTEFYTNRQVIQDFKDYIKHHMTHLNPYTGLTYAEDPTIFAYETGNELFGAVFADKQVPIAWTREIAQLIKKLGPKKLVIDGTYGINTTALSIPEVDIYSDHFYPLNNTKLESDMSLVSNAKKVYLVGEIDWTVTNPQADSLESFYKTIEVNRFSNNPVVAGDLFWSLFSHAVPDCNTWVRHNEPYSLYYGDPANTAGNNSRISTIREHFFAMQGITVDDYLPAVACPHTYIPGYDAQYTYV